MILGFPRAKQGLCHTKHGGAGGISLWALLTVFIVSFLFFSPDWELLLGNQMIWMLIVLVSLDVHICTRFNHCMTDNKNTLLKEMHHVDSDTDIVMILKTNCKFNVLHFQMIYKMNMSCFLYFYLFIFFLNNTKAKYKIHASVVKNVRKNKHCLWFSE